MRTHSLDSRSRSLCRWILSVLLAGTFSVPLLAQTGGILGHVRGAESSNLPGARVVVQENGVETFTDAAGRFEFTRMPAGTYTLTLSQGSNTATFTVKVEPGITKAVETAVDWQPVLLYTITVEAPSRRPERVVDAPAAVSAL